MTVEELRNFEEEVVSLFEQAKIKGPVHLSYGNETPLIEIFKNIKKDDWVFSTWRNHYHALLKGIPKDWLMNEILNCRSINISNGEYKFHTSAIVGGVLPIATGVASALKKKGVSDKVWCFIGDMAYSIGAFQDSYKYATVNNLPITFIVEDNGLSTNTPTRRSWGFPDLKEDFSNSNLRRVLPKLIYYKYERLYPHVGIGQWIHF